MSDSEHGHISDVDVDMENEDLDGEPEIDNSDGVEEESAVDDDDEEEEEVEGDDFEEEATDGGGEASAPPSPPPAAPRFKLTLKLPPRSVSTPTPAPDDAVSRDLDIESEDEEEEEARGDYEDADADADMDVSRSVSSSGPSGRAMTTRQAVLASVVDSTHVSLSEISRKKKPLNDAEIALRREETARKRKNMSEKKLEDEKMETINRLLKKQSRPRNKRNALATADEPTPTPPSKLSKNLAPTPGSITPIPDDEDADGEGGTPGSGQIPHTPEMYRWVSSSRGEGEGRNGTLSHSIPVNAMGYYSAGIAAASVAPKVAPRVPNCDFADCALPRKYRLVMDYCRGACGIEHLKLLESM